METWFGEMAMPWLYRRRCCCSITDMKGTIRCEFWYVKLLKVTHSIWDISAELNCISLRILWSEKAVGLAFRNLKWRRTFGQSAPNSPYGSPSHRHLIDLVESLTRNEIQKTEISGVKSSYHLLFQPQSYVLSIS